MSEGYIKKIKKRATTIYTLFGTLVLGLALLGTGVLYSQMSTTDSYNQALATGKTSQDIDSLLKASKIFT